MARFDYSSVVLAKVRNPMQGSEDWGIGINELCHM